MNKLRRGREEGQSSHTSFVVYILYFMVILACMTIVVLLVTIINGAFGLVVIQETNPLNTLGVTATSIDALSSTEMRRLLNEHVSTGVIRRLNAEKPLTSRSAKALAELVQERVVQPKIIKSYTLAESIFKKADINNFIQQGDDSLRTQFRSWINLSLIKNPQSAAVESAGIRTALFGSLWMMVLSLLLAFPIGVATAIYLEEYASNNIFNRLLRINIYNLAGIPSIIYGILGLAIFVRALEPLTSGSIFGEAENAATNGRTVISAAATLALLILPIIIINAQEAIRAVPKSMRDSSYGLGATKWQTIWNHVLPYSFDRIITSAILAVSRAVGETAPLIVVGATTFITIDPKGIFSKFTTLPIQIYQWAARPQDEFRRLASAAIIVLLIMLLTMNSIAIILRNHYSKKIRAVL